MRPWVYPFIALVAYVGATTGSDIIGLIRFEQKTLGQAAAEHLRVGLSDGVVTIFLMIPFAFVGLVSAAVQKWSRTRSAATIFAAGTLVLLYSYFGGYQAHYQALADEKWTAAALSVGVVPFAVGIPVMFLVGLAAGLAIAFDPRVPTNG